MKEVVAMKVFCDLVVVEKGCEGGRRSVKFPAILCLYRKESIIMRTRRHFVIF